MKSVFPPALADENGSVLLVVVLILPVLTLFCIFASQMGSQDLQVTTNDRCHRSAFYSADGSVYGTAKLISLVGKHDIRQKVESGEGNAAPGIQYLNSEADQAEFFRHLLTSNASESTTEDLAFVQTDPANDIGLQSTVDIEKQGPGGTPSGGGAEFGSGGEGIGTQMSVVIFRIRGQGTAPCPNTGVPVVGDYWMITNKDGHAKGI